MEKNVGSLQEQALKRKERLKALRDKQLHVSFCREVSVSGKTDEETLAHVSPL